MTDLDFRSLALWRELAEHVERWRAAQRPSRRRQSFAATDVPEHLRHLLATPARKRQTWRAYDEKSERWVDGAYAAGKPMLDPRPRGGGRAQGAGREMTTRP